MLLLHPIAKTEMLTIRTKQQLATRGWKRLNFNIIICRPVGYNTVYSLADKLFTMQKYGIFVIPARKALTKV